MQFSPLLCTLCLHTFICTQLTQLNRWSPLFSNLIDNCWKPYISKLVSDCSYVVVFFGRTGPDMKASDIKVFPFYIFVQIRISHQMVKLWVLHLIFCMFNLRCSVIFREWHRESLEIKACKINWCCLIWFPNRSLQLFAWWYKLAFQSWTLTFAIVV